MNTKALITIFLVLILTATAFPQDRCKSGAQVFGDVYKKWGDVIIATGCVAAVNAGTGGLAVGLTLQCISKADKYAKAAEEMVKYFNASADNGRWTIGPRRIDWGQPQTGSVVSTLSRVFISAAPIDKDSVTVRVKKTDGRAKADVIICKVGQEVTKTVSGVKGQLVQVRIDADSAVKKFEYRLTVSK